jgi:hypothetical protein
MSKEYSASDIKASIEKRLNNSRIKPENNAKLQRVLNWLKGESNVIAVDFLKRLSSGQKIAVLEDRVQELKTQESSLLEETEEILMQAKRIVSNK